MNIFEQLENIDKIIENKFDQEAQNMMQILVGGNIGGLGFAGSGLHPLSTFYKDQSGNIIDMDRDDVPDNIDYHLGRGQYDPHDLNHNGIPDYLED